MNDAIALSFDQSPSFFSSYRRVLFGRRRGLEPGQPLPRISATYRGIAVARERLEAYRALCGIGDEPGLPLCYPHVLASALHMSMLTHPRFPFGLMGSLHLRNHIIRYRPIQPDQRLDLECAVVAHRFRPQGVEIDVDTSLTSGNERAWREISTFLIRKQTGGDDPASPLADFFSWPDDNGEVREVDKLVIPSNVGRRFARITGDYNPIHISRLLAKVFGFKRDLAHGMWAVARATVGLDAIECGAPIRMDVTFKGPLYLSHTLAIRTAPRDGGTAMRLFCGGEERPAVLIAVAAASADAQL